MTLHSSPHRGALRLELSELRVGELWVDGVVTVSSTNGAPATPEELRRAVRAWLERAGGEVEEAKGRKR